MLKYERVVAVPVDPTDPPFHRCYLCGEYPELGGEVALMVALDNSGRNWGICGACITVLRETLDAGVIPGRVPK